MHGTHRQASDDRLLGGEQEMALLASLDGLPELAEEGGALLFADVLLGAEEDAQAQKPHVAGLKGET